MTIEEIKAKVENLETIIQSGADYDLVESQAQDLLTDDHLKRLSELHCRVLLSLSQSLWLRGSVKDALPYAKNALIIAQEYEDKNLKARAMSNIGIVYKGLSDHENALEYHHRALALYQEIGNKKGMAVSMGNIGGVYYFLSDYEKAIENYSRSLRLHEQLDNQTGVANNTGNIGNVYLHLSDYEKALEYHHRALAIHQKFGNKSGVAIYTGNIGNVYSRIFDYEKALQYYSRALALNEELGEKSGMASCIGNIGTVYIEISDYEKALQYFTRALALNEELGEKSGMAINIGNIGILYANEKYQNHDDEKAEEYLLKALSIVQEIGAKKVQYIHHKSLAELYEKQMRWKEFAVHFKKFYELEKEVQSEDAKKQAEKLDYERKTAEREKQLAIERTKHEATVQLLHNVLPQSIAAKMLSGATLIAEKLPSVSVLFADIVDFTKLSQCISPEELVEGLDTIFSTFDTLAEKYGLEKIKTIGDAYMVAAGVPEQRDDHAEAIALFALEIVESMKVFNSKSTGEQLHLRIGIHSGEVVAGVIGKKKFAYDIWGDAVNTAARMESHGEAGRIHVSEAFMRAATEHSRSEVVKTGHALSLHTATFSFSPRGEMEIKGKGTMRTYFLERGFDKL